MFQALAIPLHVQNGFITDKAPNVLIKVIRLIRMLILELLNALGVVNDRLNLTSVSHDNVARVGLVFFIDDPFYVGVRHGRDPIHVKLEKDSAIGLAFA